MSEEHSERSAAIAGWKVLLNDSVTLLETPGRHHKRLLQEANTLLIDRDDLSDMLELADGALAYAIEEQCGS